jgi:hypothetical protein
MREREIESSTMIPERERESKLAKQRKCGVGTNLRSVKPLQL